MMIDFLKGENDTFDETYVCNGPFLSSSSSRWFWSGRMRILHAARCARGSVDQSRPSTVEEVTYWRKAMLIDEDPHGQEWKNPTTKGRKGAFIRDFCTLFLVGSLMEEQDRVMEYLSRHIDGVKTRDRPARPGLAAARSLLFLEYALYFNYSQY